jgi:hypothetical protein
LLARLGDNATGAQIDELADRAGSLYDQDFVAWVAQQVELSRVVGRLLRRSL